MLAANPEATDAHGLPEIKRFLTGVIGSECTGVITTPDQRTMFTNIQHPGEDGGSTWPQEDGIATPARPRSWSPTTTAGSSAVDVARWAASSGAHGAHPSASEKFADASPPVHPGFP